MPNLDDRPVARHRRRRPDLCRRGRRVRLPRAGRRRRPEVRLADRSRAEGRRPFADIWRTFATRTASSSRANRLLFRWSNGTIAVSEPTSRFNRGSVVDGRLYLTMPETGLNVLEGDTFRPLPGTASLGREVYPVVLPLRREAAAHRHAPERIVSLRRRSDDAIPERARRADQGAIALSRPGAARRHVRACDDDWRASGSSIGRAGRSRCSIRRAACRTTPSTT